MAKQQSSTDHNKTTSAEVHEPTVVQFRDVTAAAYRIKKGVRETPLEVLTSCDHCRSGVITMITSDLELKL